MKGKRFLWFLVPLSVLVMGLVLVGNARAQAPAPSDDQVNAIARQLYCPVCENVPLDVCPTQACAQWREQIRTLLAQGKTPDEIKAIFVTQFGERVLGTPPARGINWLVYVFPPVAVLVGLFILYRVFKSWRTPVVPISNHGSSPSLESGDEYVHRFEEELNKK